MIEVLVTLAIIAVMAAVMIPSLSSRVRVSNSTNVSQNLKTINDAIQKYRENVGYYPSQLVLLTTKPTTANTDACGITLSTTDVTLWQGPYLSLTVTSNGIKSGDATIRNNLVRSPTNTSSSTVMDGTLSIFADSVTTAMATDVEGSLDAGSTDFTTGTIRYTAASSTLTYLLPITGC
ncbi:MAG: type II secretion system GspH family protein [Gemmatimonadota bacterium]|nr:type II secretion system GspH family protein [Gemmatimonadota bacterium]